MRIIGGRLRGRKLALFKGRHTRPTADRLRESIFSILADRVASTVVLDLFAGTGALGLEALSRGASTAVFIDNDPAALDTIRRNVAALHLADRATIIRWNALSNLNCLHALTEPIDLVFMDPPYRSESLAAPLAHLCNVNVLAAGARLVIEHSREDALPEIRPPLQLHDQRRYGKVLVTFLTYMVTT